MWTLKCFLKKLKLFFFPKKVEKVEKEKEKTIYSIDLKKYACCTKLATSEFYQSDWKALKFFPVLYTVGF